MIEVAIFPPARNNWVTTFIYREREMLNNGDDKNSGMGGVERQS